MRPIEGFDCMAFKRKTQAQIYKEIKGMTAEEELAYFRRKTRESGTWRKFQKKTVAR